MVEIYCEKMFDLLHPSQRALDKGKGLPASLGGRGLSNAANIPVKSNEHVKRYSTVRQRNPMLPEMLPWPSFVDSTIVIAIAARVIACAWSLESLGNALTGWPPGLLRVLEEADDRRAAAVLKGRSSSSRSHTVAVVNLWQKTNMEVLESSAIFVDLAGSEDMTQSGLSQQEVMQQI